MAYSEVDYSESGDGYTLYIKGSGGAERSGVLKGSYKGYRIIDIGNDITSLGNEIFLDCIEVTQIKMPSFLSYIGKSAFKNCIKLTSIEIPEGVQSILENTFYGDSLLKSIKLPSTISSIDVGSAFYNCDSLDTYEISTANNYFKSSDSKDMLIASDGISALKSRGYGEIVVPWYIENLNINFAAHFSSVTSISFPNSSLKTVNSYLFYHTSIKKVTFPHGMLKIIGDTFYRSQVTSVFLPSTITEISTRAFFDCESLNSVEYENGCALKDVDNVLYTVDNKNIIFVPPNKVTLNIGPTVTGVLSTHLTKTADLLHVNVDPKNDQFSSSEDVMYKVNQDNKYYTLFAIPKKLRTVNVHRDCVALGEKAMITTQVEAVVFLGDSVTRFESECLSVCTELKGFTFPPKTSFIGPYSFYGSKHSSSYVFSEALTGVSGFCFAGSENIRGADFSQCRNLNTFHKNMFQNCHSLEEIILPPSLGEVTAQLCENCRSLKSVEIPGSCSKISSMAFSGCENLASVIFTPTSNVRTLAVDSFVGCAMESISLPKSLVSIESGAFRSCKNLKTINIEEDSNLNSILSDVFDGCESLEEVSLPSKLQTISPGAFSVCRNLKNIFISDKNIFIKDIEGVVFSYDHALLICPNGRYVYHIPDDVVSIGYKAFYGCLHLYDLSFEGSRVESIGENTLSGCTNLTAVSLPSSLRALDVGAFSGCSLLSAVEFASDCPLSAIRASTFTGCPRLSWVQFPSGLVEIADSAFEGCSIGSLDFPESLSFIGASAFKNNVELKTLLIKANVSSIGPSAFAGCSSLTKISYCGTAEISTAVFTGVGTNCVFVPLGYSHRAFGGLSAFPILDLDCKIRTEVFTYGNGISYIVANLTLLDFSLNIEH